MLGIGSAEQAVDRDVEVIFGNFASVIVFAELGENVRRDDVGASGIMR